ncbi:hypothetical protein EVG20_g9889 [Dentipellis fragilis]|uniref:Reverse transcriptase Ty1/copia-type domain-containing protein n=1 Tax=Dentipellis fragilis TaxID=205917 RepID=A0A4Y9XV14_9AGAM|nr:hypothetical protein EVG20_g9889 [Dentipellis fragilis]
MKEALARPDSQEWMEAFLEEMNAHKVNKTWQVVPLPPGCKAIGSRWVLAEKDNYDGTLERRKARIVAQGFSQRPGVDFFETFAPTAKFASIRTVLALAAVEDLHLRSFDISHAFINGDLDVVVYMRQPEGFHEGGPEMVCQLDKALYGLRQAARLWRLKLMSVLVDKMGFTCIHSDNSIYVFQKGNVRVIMPVFVDDGTMASNSLQILDTLVTELATHFKLRDLGETSYLLGIHITRDRGQHRLYLSQRKYILEMLERYHMGECTPVTTPMDPGLRLSKAMSPATDEEREEMAGVPYINAVGSLLYLAQGTRPDISYAVGVLCRFCAYPGQAHWKAVKHLFRYLKGTLDLKLAYGGPSFSAAPKELFSAYSDADHGGNPDNGRSTSGYVLHIGAGAVSWSSKLQPFVTKSTTEAEYVAGVDAGSEVLWMRNLLTEYGYRVEGASTLHMDNQSAISTSKHPEHHGRMQHLDLRFYWLREKVEEGIIRPVFIPTDQMPADILTKALARDRVVKCREMLGLVE